MYGCVGTIEQTNIQKTKSFSAEFDYEDYKGLLEVNPVSHNKIELLLKAPSGSVPGDLRFEIFINFSDKPSYISGDSLLEVSPNTFIHTIENLEMNTKYAFQVGVQDKSRNIKFEKNDAIYGKTFSYETANFNGVTEVSPLPGKKGESSVLVKWTPAETGSSTFKLSASDPIAYEVSYTSSSNGISSLKSNDFTSGGKFTIPSSLAAIISYDSQVVVSGLTPGTKYFFRVRAINYGYYLDQKEKSGLNYSYEQNNKIISTVTNNISLEYGLSDTFIFTRPSSGFDALNSIDVEWSRGTGGFSEYRLFIKKLCPTCADESGCHLNIKNCGFIRGTSCNPYSSASGEGCLRVDSTVTSTTVADLDEYQEYQVVVVACGGENCSEKAFSKESSVFTYPKISQFEGISSVEFAKSPAELLSGDVHFSFPSIDTERGYLDDLNLWCFENPQNLSTSTLVKVGGELTPINGSICDAIRVKNDFPQREIGFDAYKKEWEELETITVTLGGEAYQENRNYCFGISPSINQHGDFSPVNITSDGMITDDARKKMIVRCFQLKRLQPNLEQFVGKNDTCEEGIDSFGNTIPLSLRVSYKEPTGGIFNYYRVFIKSETSELFSFEKAKINGVELVEGAVCEDGQYCYVDVPKGTNYFDFKNLIPAKRYATAVLPILKELGVTYASESNSRTGVCQVKIPQISFNEWTNVISLGPKTDARYETKYVLNPDGSYSVVRHHLEERLDEDFAPVEIDQPEIVQKSIFDGVFNVEQKDWSNKGIIHLEWKDLVFGKRLVDETNGTYEDETFFDILYKINDSIFLTPKNQRKYGYRVLRSSDMGVNWVDLTKVNTQGGLTNQYVQTEENSGLVYPCYFVDEVSNAEFVQSCRTRFYHNGLSAYHPRTVSFTDYSVMNANSVNDFDRARVYLYKVEVVFNDISIPLIGEDNVIKVVLPPPNMSFAHRKIINRSMCLDLSVDGNFRELNKNPNGHYSCSYDGLGSSGQSTPWYSGDTVYDIGGDLIIDRFELGCNWTRGDAADWSASAMPSDLANYNETKGCVAKSYSDDTGAIIYDEYPLSTSSSGLSEESYVDMKRARKGDCVGSWVTKLSQDKSDNTALNFSINRYTFPGAFGGPNYTDASNANENGHFLQSYFRPSSSIETADQYVVQSEFAAVLYNRASFSAYNRGYIGDITSGNEGLASTLASGENFNQVGPTTNDGRLINLGKRSLMQTDSKCWVNLSYLDSATGVKPRWFSVNQLLSSSLLNGNAINDLQDASGSSVSLGDLSINELKNPLHKMYLENGNSEYQMPEATSNRYFPNLNIMRVLTTNAAKAPPISNIGQEEANKLCQKYKISLVVKPNDENNEVHQIAQKKKRLPSKKEFIAFSAWPDTFDAESIQKLESRQFSQNDRRDGAPSDRQVNGCNTNSGVSPLEDEQGVSLDLSIRKVSLEKVEDGDFITPALPNRINDGVAAPLSLFFSGSSQIDPSGESNVIDSQVKNYNSEKCVSRFGIQDAVGNIMEMTADRIFCNFNDREMWFKIGDENNFTRTTGVLAYSSEMSGQLSADFDVRRDQSLNNLVMQRLETSPLEYNYRNLLGIKILESANVFPYVPQAQSKMYCNVVGAGHDLQETMTYVEGSEMYSPVFDFFLDFLDRKLLGPIFNHFNISILNDLRNGDGTFLDFGSASELGEPKKSQALLFSDDISSVESGNFIYFNPIVGMPLSCAAGSCEGSSDNRLFRIENNNFNLGNSSFQNDGVNDYISSRASKNISFNERHITRIESTNEAFFDDVVDSSSEIASGTPYVTYTWRVADSSFFNFSVGGAARYNSDPSGEALSGRYSFILRGNNSYTQEISKDDTGLRCVVKINEND